MKKFKSIPLFIAAFSTLFLLFSGCNKDATTGLVQLNFNHNVAGQDVAFNDTWYPCAVGHKFSVTRLKYYLSNFTLHESDGTQYPTDIVQYCDLELPESETLLLKDIPNGEYTALSFIIGLDAATNVDGGLPNTTTNINMEWPIPGDQGYHYMKFEGRYDSLSTGVIKNYNLHFGATGGNQNFVEITLPLNSLKMNGDGWKINLAMDMNEWLQNPNTYDFETFGSMIMTNQDAQQTLKENGATVFSVTSVERQ